MKKYSDLWSLASAAENKILPVVQQADNQAKDAKATTDRLKQDSSEAATQIANLKPRLEALRKDADKFAELDKSVDNRFSTLQASLDKKLKDVQGQVNQIRQIVPGLERWSVKTGQVGNSPCRENRSLFRRQSKRMCPGAELAAARELHSPHTNAW